MKRSYKLLKNKYAIATIVFLLLVIAFLVFHKGKSGGKIESASAVLGDVIEKVSVTGKVSPVGKADLAFEKGGVVKKINVVVGDHVKKGQVIAMLDSGDDRAALASAQASLSEVQRGLRPEEYSADQATVNSSATNVENARKDALNAVRDGYVKAQSSLVNQADTFFSNPQSANPSIYLRTTSQLAAQNINNERIAISDVFTSWKADIDSLASPSNADVLLAKSEGYLSSIKNFMSDLSVIVNSQSTTNSSASSASINQNIAIMNSALSNLNLALASVTGADTALKSAAAGFTQTNNNFTLQKAGSSPDTINAQAAKVAGAQAQLDKDSIVAPIDGLITRVDPSLGEFVSPGQAAIGVISDGEYKIEAYVPEADIAKIALHNHASITLDAYGSDTLFPASVQMIDPAETVLEGVSTYKVTLFFDSKDERIRSGMTANIDIFTHEKDNVVSVPTRAIIDDKGNKTIRVLKSDGQTYDSVPVVVGLKGSDGTTEIISGIVAGDKVVTFTE